MTSRSLALTLCGLWACSGSPSTARISPPVAPPTATGSAATPDVPAPSTPAPSTPAPSSLALDDATRAALTGQLERLAALGTGASLAVAIDGAIAPFVTGTLLPEGPAVAPTSRFNVASVSKLLTAAKIVHLAHTKALSLDDPVAKHLTGVHFVDDGGDDLADRITIEQLLMHRGGLPHWDPAFDPKTFGSSWQDPELLSKMGRGWTLALKNEPGTYGYSNLGYATLAAIIETVEGCSFADCMAPFLAGPLELKSATMWPPSLTGDAAHGKTVKDGEVTFLPPGWYGSRLAVPYTGLWISMPDLAAFGARLVAARRDPDAPLRAMTTGIPATETGHGRGPVHSRHGTLVTLRHDGSGPGFLADLVIVPERELALALAVNGGGDTKPGGETLREVSDAMLAALGVDR